VHGLYGVIGAVFDEAFPAPESRSFGGDCNAAAVDVELVGGRSIVLSVIVSQKPMW